MKRVKRISLTHDGPSFFFLATSSYSADGLKGFWEELLLNSNISKQCPTESRTRNGWIAISRWSGQYLKTKPDGNASGAGGAVIKTGIST
jgi:hypothetical protein